MPDPEDLSDVFRVEIANLSDQGRDDVLDALQANPEMSQDDAEALIGRTEQADEARDDFDALQKDQQDLMEHGDWEAAHDRAQEAEYEMREVEDLGGEGEHEILEAQNDQHEIDDAISEHHESQEAAHDAADYAAHGMDGAAEVYAQSAGDHAAASVDNAAAANPSEYNTDHTDAQAADHSADYDASAV